MNNLAGRRFNRRYVVVSVLTILLSGALSWGQRLDGIKPPLGLGADGRGLSGAWEAILNAEGKQWRAVKEEADKIQSAMTEKEGSLQQKVNELNQQIETKRRECGEIDARIPPLEEQLRDVERKALKDVAAAREAEQRAWVEVNQKFSQNR